MAHYELDARHLLCPLPVIRTQDRMQTLQPGDTLAVLCTDPGAEQDIPAWCRINGHQVLDIRHADEQLIITIQAGETA